MRLRLYILLTFIPLLLSAQEDSTRIIRDSLHRHLDQPEVLITPAEIPINGQTNSPLLSAPTQSPVVHIPLEKPILLPYYTNPSPMFKGDYSTGGILFAHRKGMLTGFGAQTSLPGIGRKNEASFGYHHLLNERFSFQLGLEANKLLMPHFAGNEFGVSGGITYRLSDRVALRTFGSYQTGYVPHAQSYQYGGTVAFDVSERFSLEMGVRRAYSPMRGGWETIPVLIPTYRFNKADIGLDVGGILYELLRGNIYKKQIRMQNPTLAPPRMSIPVR